MRQEKFIGERGYTMEDTRYQYKVTDRTPEGAPNVVYIVMDDMGFSHLGCYGSNIHTPNLDRLAAEGLRFNNFHTTAICSATRASLLTGLNHHSAGIASLTELMTGCDNACGHIRKDAATIAEILKEYDYSTYAVGKWHLIDVSEQTEAGPYDNWPLGKGFDRYYGFLNSQMNQFRPRLIQDNGRVEPPKTPEEGYHFSEDMTDKAIQFIFHQKVVFPEKPFFLYMAFGAMHAPHQAPKKYIEKYKGSFDEGWDVFRERWFARQKQLGIIPENTDLTERNPFVKPWTELSEKERAVASRFMEAFAGMLEHTDEQIGRLLAYLEETGELDNTVIVFLSDNGASAEGGLFGTYNEFDGNATNGTDGGTEKIDFLYEHLDDIGTEKSFNHYPQGWANAGNTPFPWYKMWTYSGGVKDAMIVRYPKLIKDPGAIRKQYHHVSDVTPTILDIIGIEKPEYIKGVHQQPLQGISFKYALEDGNAVDQKHVQYYEMIGNRAIYKDGWKAIVNHFQNKTGGTFEGDEWELYHVAEDFSEAHNVADEYPDKVKELERTWLTEAAKYNVFPMVNGVMYGAPEEAVKLYSTIRTLERLESYQNIVEPFDLIRSMLSKLDSRSHAVKVKLFRERKEQQGVIICSGNYHGGFSLYILNNRLVYARNNGNESWQRVETEELPAGDVEVEYRLKLRKDLTAKVQLCINGKLSAALDLGSILSSVDFVSTVGANRDSSVIPQDYQIPFAFEGKLKQVDLYVEGITTTIEKELEEYWAAD